MRYRIYLNTIVYEVFVVPYSCKHGPEYLPFGAVQRSCHERLWAQSEKKYTGPKPSFELQELCVNTFRSEPVKIQERC